MSEKGIYEQFREYSNLLVGFWYNKDNDNQIMIFDLLERMKDNAKAIMITDGQKTEIDYGMGINIKEEWYLHTGHYRIDSPYNYIIELLTPDMMVLRTTGGNRLTYIRKPDANFADGLLKGLS